MKNAPKSCHLGGDEKTGDMSFFVCHAHMDHSFCQYNTLADSLINKLHIHILFIGLVAILVEW